MSLISFNEWKMLNEGKKGKKGKTHPTSERKMSDVDTFRKTGKLSIEVKKGKVARGHQQHLSGAGSHESTPKRQRTRQGERKVWQKEVSESVDKFEKNTNLLYLSGLVTEEQMFEARNEIEDMLMILNSHADNLGFKYPSGNKELTEKIKKLEQEGKIHYDDIYRKWRKGKSKKKVNESASDDDDIDADIQKFRQNMRKAGSELLSQMRLMPGESVTNNREISFKEKSTGQIGHLPPNASLRINKVLADKVECSVEEPTAVTITTWKEGGRVAYIDGTLTSDQKIIIAGPYVVALKRTR